MEQERVSIQDYLSLSSSWQCSPEKLERLATEDLKRLLAEHVLSERIKSAIKGELKNRAEDFQITSVNQFDAISCSGKSYPALNIIAGVYKFCGWVLIIIGVITLLLLMAKKLVVYGLLVLAVSLFLALLSFALSESILVLTDISDSAFRILEHIQKRK